MRTSHPVQNWLKGNVVKQGARSPFAEYCSCLCPGLALVSNPPVECMNINAQTYLAEDSTQVLPRPATRIELRDAIHSTEASRSTSALYAKLVEV